MIKCNALGYSSVGKGVTKKAARHNAAENLLLKYNHQTDEDMSDDDEDAKSAATGGNAISELLDYCVVKNFHKAQFTCISEVGPSHSPTFTFECKLNSITREGKAGIKQIAKQNAAKAVLEILKMVTSSLSPHETLFYEIRFSHILTARKNLSSLIQVLKPSFVRK